MRPLLAESVEDHLCTWSLQLSCSRVLTYSVAMQLFSCRQEEPRVGLGMKKIQFQELHFNLHEIPSFKNQYNMKIVLLVESLRIETRGRE